MFQGRKKVLYLITKATEGGAQRYIFDLATHLSQGAFEPVIAYGEGGKLVEKLHERGIRSVRLSALGRDVILTADIASFFQILRLLRTEKPDVVHLNSSKAAGLGALASRIAGVPRIIFTVHGWPFREHRNLAMRIAFWLASYATALLSHAVICVSEYDLRQARQMPLVGRKALRIYNGIDAMRFGSGEHIRAAFPAGARIIGTIGELNRNKNQTALIDEARDDSEMYVAIVGEGEERTNLEKKIAFYDLGKRVRLFGFLPASDVLKGFDTFALPSRKEGLPYVLLEARAAGLPIVANRVGGVGEALDKPLSEFSLEEMVARTSTLY